MAGCLLRLLRLLLHPLCLLLVPPVEAEFERRRSSRISVIVVSGERERGWETERRNRDRERDEEAIIREVEEMLNSRAASLEERLGEKIESRLAKFDETLKSGLADIFDAFGVNNGGRQTIRRSSPSQFGISESYNLPRRSAGNYHSFGISAFEIKTGRIGNMVDASSISVEASAYKVFDELTRREIGIFECSCKLKEVDSLSMIRDSYGSIDSLGFFVFDPGKSNQFKRNRLSDSDSTVSCGLTKRQEISDESLLSLIEIRDKVAPKVFVKIMNP